MSRSGRRKKYLQFLLILFASIQLLTPKAIGQTSLLHSVPLSFNPSFAGLSGNPRLSMNANHLGSGSLHVNTSIDWLSPKLKGGVGVYVINMYSKSALGSFQQQFGFVYAPKFLINNKVAISPFLSPHLAWQNVSEISYNRTQIDFAAGVLVNTEKLYVGYKGTNFLHGFSNNTHAIQAGYAFQKNKYSKFTYIVDINHNFTSDSSALNLNDQYNFAVKFWDYLIGIGWSNSNHAVAMLGYQNKNWKLAYSYHHTQYDIVMRNEVGIQHTFVKKKTKSNKPFLPFGSWFLLFKKNKGR